MLRASACLRMMGQVSWARSMELRARGDLFMDQIMMAMRFQKNLTSKPPTAIEGEPPTRAEPTPSEVSEEEVTAVPVIVVSDNEEDVGNPMETTEVKEEVDKAKQSAFDHLQEMEKEDIQGD